MTNNKKALWNSNILVTGSNERTEKICVESCVIITGLRPEVHHFSDIPVDQSTHFGNLSIQSRPSLFPFDRPHGSLVHETRLRDLKFFTICTKYKR